MTWLNLTMPNQTVKNGLKVKNIKLPQLSFFLKKQLIKFSCTYWPFSLCNILKAFLGLIQSYEDVPFLDPKYPNSFWTKFFGTNHYYYFHLPIGPFHCTKFKKILTADQELWGFHCAKFLKNSSSESRVMRMRYFWVQNDPFPQMRIFFRKPVNEPCCFHSCLSTCQKSKSDIYLLVKYRRLKNTEISLAKNNFWL